MYPLVHGTWLRSVSDPTFHAAVTFSLVCTDAIDDPDAPKTDLGISSNAALASIEMCEIVAPLHTSSGCPVRRFTRCRPLPDWSFHVTIVPADPPSHDKIAAESIAVPEKPKSCSAASDPRLTSMHGPEYPGYTLRSDHAPEHVYPDADGITARARKIRPLSHLMPAIPASQSAYRRFSI